MSIGRTKYDLSVVSDLKTARIPCCCRQWRRGAGSPLIYGKTAVDLNSVSGSTLGAAFLTRCIKNHIVLKDLQIRPPVPTKGAHRVAEVTSMRFLRERIRLTQRARKDVKREAESTAHRIRGLLSCVLKSFFGYFYPGVGFKAVSMKMLIKSIDIFQFFGKAKSLLTAKLVEPLLC